MKKIHWGFLLAFSLVLSPRSAWSQGRHGASLRTYNPSALVAQNYADSLRIYADSLYSAGVTVPATLSDQDLAPLFLPHTCYKSVTHHALILDKTLSPLDEQLLGIYLRRPDMVTGTQSQLEASGPALAPITVTEKPSVVVSQP